MADSEPLRMEAHLLTRYVHSNLRERIAPLSSLVEILNLLEKEGIFVIPYTALVRKIFWLLQQLEEVKTLEDIENILFPFLRKEVSQKYPLLKVCIADLALKVAEVQTGIDFGWSDAKGVFLGSLCEGPVGILWRPTPGRSEQKRQRKKEPCLLFESRKGFSRWFQISGDRMPFFGEPYRWYATA